MFPFKGICERPYDQAELNGVDWRGVSTLSFPLSELWCTQQKLTLLGLFGVDTYSTDEFPHLVYCKQQLYIEDGHHRLVRKALEGKTVMFCAVLSLEEAVNDSRSGGAIQQG